MNKKNIISICLSCILIGCAHKPDNFYQRAIEHIMPLVDSGYIVDNYIHFYELATNDSNSIYEVSGMKGPFSRPEYPSKIIKQKGKFFCFTELDEPELSVEQVYELTNQYDRTLDCSNLDIWFLGISKYNKNAVLKKDSAIRVKLITYTKLWPYLSGAKPKNNNFFMCLSSHDLVVSTPDSLVADSLKYYINKISGEIDIFNRSDSTIILSANNENKAYAVVNGHDTLDLIIRETLPLKIKPNDYQTLHYVSSDNYSFFQKLPSNRTWNALYKLLSDSTFCFLKINEKNSFNRLMHNSFRVSSELKNDSGTVLQEIWNDGTFDKQDRLERFLNI